MLLAERPEITGRLEDAGRPVGAGDPGEEPAVRPGDQRAGHQIGVQAGKAQVVLEFVEMRDALVPRRVVHRDRGGEQRQPRPASAHQHLYLEGVAPGKKPGALQKLDRVEPVAALGVGERLAALQAHPEVGEVPAEKAGARHVQGLHAARADHDAGPGGSRCLQQFSRIGRIVLAVRIDGQDRLVTQLARQYRRGEYRLPLATVHRQPVAH